MYKPPGFFEEQKLHQKLKNSVFSFAWDIARIVFSTFNWLKEEIPRIHLCMDSESDRRQKIIALVEQQRTRRRDNILGPRRYPDMIHQNQ